MTSRTPTPDQSDADETFIFIGPPRTGKGACTLVPGLCVGECECGACKPEDSGGES